MIHGIEDILQSEWKKKEAKEIRTAHIQIIITAVAFIVSMLVVHFEVIKFLN